MLYANVQSCRDTRDNRRKLQCLRGLVIKKEPEILALVETWLTKDQSTGAIQTELGLEDYIIFRTDRQDNVYFGNKTEDQRRGGGILVAWKPRGDVQFEEDIDRDKVFSCIDGIRSFIIKRKMNCSKCNNGKTLVCVSFRVCYRRPGPYAESLNHAREGKNSK